MSVKEALRGRGDLAMGALDLCSGGGDLVAAVLGLRNCAQIWQRQRQRQRWIPCKITAVEEALHSGGDQRQGHRIYTRAPKFSGGGCGSIQECPNLTP